MEKCQKYLLLWQRKIYNYSLTFLAKVIVFLLFCPTLIQFQYKPLLVYQKFKRFIVSLYNYHVFYLFFVSVPSGKQLKWKLKHSKLIILIEVFQINQLILRNYSI